VLCELTWEDEADGGLDLSGGEGWLLVDAAELGCLAGDLLKHVGDEGVEDGHSLGADAGVWVHLLQDLEDVELVALHSLLGLLSVLDGFLCCLLSDRLLSGCWSHCD